MPDHCADHLDPHPLVEDLVRDETVVFEPADADPQCGTVHRFAVDGEPPGGYCSVEVHVDGTIWDLEATYEPRDGWGTLWAAERLYHGNEMDRVRQGAVERIEAVDIGVAPEDLAPGVTAEHWSGDQYRIVVGPAERESDDKALAFNLDSSSNVLERVSPDEIRSRSLSWEVPADV